MAENLSYRNHRAVTAADADIAPFDALFVAGAGTAVVTDKDGTVVTYTVPAGTIIPVVGYRVAAASTGTGIVALNY